MTGHVGAAPAGEIEAGQVGTCGRHEVGPLGEVAGVGVDRAGLVVPGVAAPAVSDPVWVRIRTRGQPGGGAADVDGAGGHATVEQVTGHPQPLRVSGGHPTTSVRGGREARGPS
jgi:hypothetical protein